MQPQRQSVPLTRWPCEVPKQAPPVTDPVSASHPRLFHRKFYLGECSGVFNHVLPTKNSADGVEAQ